MAHVPDLDFHKRHRDPQETGVQHGDHLARTPPVRSGVFNQLAGPYINYVPRANAERLSLIEGDHDTFSHIVSLIGDYEGVLDRHESLAANLGAKLTGPRLLKGIEKFFDGPIKTSSSQPVSAPISWLDVVAFAKASPGEFSLTTMPDGSRCCRFSYNGVLAEITEDDWRLISSGALDRFPLEHPFEEDETAELATLDILEQRASILYKKADEVAARARILHHRLGHRKNDLSRRRSQDIGGPRHQPTNTPGRQHSFSPSYDLHADLLQQFLTMAPSNIKPQSASDAGLSAINLGPSSPSVHSPHHHQHRLSTQSSRPPGGTLLDNQMVNSAESRGEILRSLICQSTDRLSKGNVINPPCDRCRRLRLPCIKHLTACQGCTKKHAKCSWNRPVIQVIATNVGPGAAAAPDDKAGNLAKHVPVCIGARLMLTCNLWQQVGLCNGARGTVYDIGWAPGADPVRDQPCVIMMEFDKYTGPAFLTTADGRKIVPILPVDRDFLVGVTLCTRTQFPLIVCYAITVHKSQSITEDKIVTDLSCRDFQTGLSYVAVSRVKTLQGLMLDAPFDRNHLTYTLPPEGIKMKMRDQWLRSLQILTQNPYKKVHGAT
ncbi:hypothetical protein MAJ_08130, partial [Metarhizium majus ARSEF 297]